MLTPVFTQVKSQKTQPIIHGTVLRFFLYGDHDRDVFATGGLVEVRLVRKENVCNVFLPQEVFLRVIYSPDYTTENTPGGGNEVFIKRAIKYLSVVQVTLGEAPLITSDANMSPSRYNCGRTCMWLLFFFLMQSHKATVGICSVSCNVVVSKTYYSSWKISIFGRCF